MGRKIDLYAVSRMASHALRHEPWLYELELDDNGWVPVEHLVAAFKTQNPKWEELCEQTLQAMIDTSEKKRHEIKNGMIRAMYGHSMENGLKKETATPPKTLFHGTSPEIAELIMAQGLKPMTRQFVHLSPFADVAIQVGGRKSTAPLILTVDALRASDDGFKFYIGNDKVWLSDEIPPQYLKIND